MQKKLTPRVIVWISALLFLAGFSITSVADSLITLYLGFGVLAGLASGLVYNAVMSSVTSWFPDKQGFISGLLLMGFGISGFIIGKVYTAVTPMDSNGGWRTTFLVFGFIIFVVMAFAGFFIVKNDKQWDVDVTENVKESEKSYEEICSKEMVVRPSFWLYLFWATSLSAAGLAIISQGAPMAMEACPEITMSTVATVVGLISVFNGVGRIVFGTLFDKIGHFFTMVIGSVIFIIAIILLITALTSHMMVLLIVAYIVTGLAYGCITPTGSAYVNRFYGSKNYPINLSVVNMNMLVSSFGSMAAGIVFDLTHSYVAILEMVIILVVLGTVASFFIRKPKEAHLPVIQ